MKLALIGHPLGHSFSAAYFAEKFRREGLSDYSYENLDVEDLNAAIPVLKAGGEYGGFNVTVPYKQAIIPFLDELSPEAEAIGAVNTIKVTLDGKWVGYNTDFIGFTESLKNFLEGDRHASEDRGAADTRGALVIGNGGASRAVQYALAQLKIPYYLVTARKDEAEKETNAAFRPGKILSYDDAGLASCLVQAKILINTTSLGMWPDVDSRPTLPYRVLTPGHKAFDLVYNPEETAFMKACVEQGATVKNGLEMLHLQADASWKIFQKTAETGRWSEYSTL